MRIIFVRHGDPDYELDCLTGLGHRQAAAVARRLLDEGIEEIYCSPMGRARQTAQAFSDASGIRAVTVLDFMREIRFGREDDLYNEDWSPWVVADRMAAAGEDLHDASWRELPRFRGNTATADVDAVMAASDGWLASLGYRREGLYYRNLREDDAQHTVVLFSHGGSSTAFLSRVLNAPFLFLCASLHIPHTGVTVLRLDRTPGKLSVPVVELMNDGRHTRGL